MTKKYWNYLHKQQKDLLKCLYNRIPDINDMMDFLGIENNELNYKIVEELKWKNQTLEEVLSKEVYGELNTKHHFDYGNSRVFGY